MTSPRIVVTLTARSDRVDPSLERSRERYLDAVRRHGGSPVPIDARTPATEVEAALASMNGLLLSGGVDIDPAHYGQPNNGSREIQADRDALEAQAWAAAAARSVPVLGICRGLQAINVFAGGSLVQHVDGHESPGHGSAPTTHPISLVDGSRLATLLAAESSSEPLVVNAFHHQGVTAADLAPGLVASAWADSSAGPLVEGLEAPGERFVVGVQCHPERTESTPPTFEQVFAAFVDASRRPAA